MLYTLLKFLGWGLLLAFVGGCIGWALRALKCRGELARARALNVDSDEVERMRHRLANLEQVVAERDRLRMQLADMRPTEVATPAHGIAGIITSGTADSALASAGGSASDEPPAPELDLEEAASVVGKKIKLDDLTAVEGIGPKIAELCHGIGVTTWRALADTPVEDLQSMLDAAGSRYQIHNPTTWPRQAGLLAEGHWSDFKALTDQLNGGT